MKNDKSPAERLSGLLGMAKRAGRLTAGYDAVTALASGGKAKVILFASDLSEKTEKEVRFAAKEHRTVSFRIPMTKEEMGHCVGFKKPVGVLAIEDKGFAAAIEKLCRGELEEECIL